MELSEPQDPQGEVQCFIVSSSDKYSVLGSVLLFSQMIEHFQIYFIFVHFFRLYLKPCPAPTDIWAPKEVSVSSAPGLCISLLISFL